MSADHHNETCARVETLSDAARPLSAREQREVARHLEGCAGCRDRAALEALMDLATQGPPGPALDEVSRRRLLSGVVEAAAARDAQKEQPSDEREQQAISKTSAAPEDWKERSGQGARAPQSITAPETPGEEPRAPTPAAATATITPRRRRRRAMIAAAAVVAGLALGLLWLLGRYGPSSSREDVGADPGAGASHARVLLAAGDLTLVSSPAASPASPAPSPSESPAESPAASPAPSPSESPAPSPAAFPAASPAASPAAPASASPGPGTRLRQGHRLSTGTAAAAAVRLPPATTALLGARTVLELRRLSARGRAGLRLHLARGTLSVTVRPDRVAGSPVEVTTPHGRVRVVGTIFQVRVTAERTAVSVNRGVVEATHGGERRRVRHGQALTLGVPRPTPLDPEARARLQEVGARLRLLQRAQGASLAVDSDPRGAKVTLEGVTLGRTPLRSNVPTGHATLRVDSAAHQRVTELLAIRAGEHVRRDYSLTPRREAPRGASPRAQQSSRPQSTHRAASPRPGAERKAARPGAPAEPPARSSTARPAGPTSAPALMKRAQHRRLARDWQGAIRTYRALIRRHPQAPSAHVARVSIGTIQLDHLGRPAAALRSFDRYLRHRRSGALAQEASFGRLRALRALGRTCAELRGLRDFVKRYPRSLHRARAKQRLQALQVLQAQQSGPGARCP